MVETGAAPAGWIRSATSSGGRDIYFPASDSPSSGLAVAPHVALGKMDEDRCLAQVAMAQQQLDGVQVSAGLKQMSREANAGYSGPGIAGHYAGKGAQLD